MADDPAVPPEPPQEPFVAVGWRLLPEDRLILARTIYGEARGEDEKGKRAIAHVVFNRVTFAYGTGGRDHTVAAACLRWKQFSCWNWGDPNRAKVLAVSEADAVLKACLFAVRMAEAELDFTGGARWYHAAGAAPVWAVGKTPCFVHGQHVFYDAID